MDITIILHRSLSIIVEANVQDQMKFRAGKLFVSNGVKFH